MYPQYKNGREQIERLTKEFLVQKLGAVIASENSVKAIGMSNGDGVVTGTVRLLIDVDIDLSTHPFPVGDGTPHTIEA